MSVRILGIRHHSPACARLAARIIAQEKPCAVLIEGPSDFNHRIGELLLDHTLPVALYSYANEGQSPAQCWFPFLDYSPEWVALRSAAGIGAMVRFIDLPHWQYRAVPDARQRLAAGTPQRSRYAERIERLCRRFGCDGDNALWDHLFESPSAEEDLQQRLDLYFDELRTDDPGTPQDQAREQCMAQWVAWAHTKARQSAVEGMVLVICGGWHKRALEALWPTLDGAIEPECAAPADARQAGSYLVPFEFRQVDALGGYWAGMQSPLFYQWAWHDGLAVAGRRAIEQIVQRLRHKKVVVSTADLIALEHSLAGLCNLRGHPVALRTDMLDALQSALIKEALELPPPWTVHGPLSAQHHPVLREALLALTGEGAGKLHADTPLPPLLHDVSERLAQTGIDPGSRQQTRVFDRRRDTDSRAAQVLWQLKLLGVEGVNLLGMRAPNAARSLPAALQFEEQWSIVRDDHWFPNLIEAAAYGATLDAAARNRLLESVHAAQGDATAIARCMLQAVRAGLSDMGLELATRLQHELANFHDHEALATAAHTLLEVVQAGFWGTDSQSRSDPSREGEPALGAAHASNMRPLLEGTLVALAARLLWLLENRQGSQPAQITGDVQAVRVFDVMLRIGLGGFDATSTLETLLRFVAAPQKPPALRGAALAVCYVHEGLGQAPHAQLLAAVRAVPPRDALGDFLYGLFSCARAVATESDDIVNAVHAALESMSTEEFLVAAPQLRAAFSWFPPRERGAIAALIAKLLGLSGAEQDRLLSLQQDAAALVDAKRIEAQAMAWAKALGVVT